MVRILLMQSNQKLRKNKSKRGIDEVARAKKEAIDRIQDATTEERSCKSESRPSGNGSQRPYQ